MVAIVEVIVEVESVWRSARFAKAFEWSDLTLFVSVFRKGPKVNH